MSVSVIEEIQGMYKLPDMKLKMEAPLVCMCVCQSVMGEQKRSDRDVLWGVRNSLANRST